MDNDICLGCDGRGYTGLIPGYPGQRWRYYTCGKCGGSGKRRTTPWGCLIGGALALVLGAAILTIVGT